ncbi:glutathione S-transferase family protein [uncultured Erythrobacter sp.]|uniref:glutathione S-transferase family protein n=1 Tax=uncultured Erythrobacter sp. TaxID=263913 RepID=UPI002618EE7F|nr:glutathione S-transferase family protein [uncultured Erythrobacter sp.]
MSEEAADIVIYGSPLSPFVRKAAAVCIEKDIPFEVEPVNVFDPPQWFRDISPMKRIPVMRDRSIAADGVAGTIADSSAICAYLERKHPEPALYCRDAFAHGRALMIEEYVDTTLAASGGLGIFRPIFFSITQGKEPDIAKARETWATAIPPMLAFLDAELSGKTFCAEEAVSIADISIACVMMQIALVAETPLDDYPALAAHYARMAERPSIAAPYAKAEAIVRKAMPDRAVIS